MHVAFDYGSTLNDRPQIQDLSRLLPKAKKHLISACDTWEEPLIAAFLKEHGLEFESVNFVKHGAGGYQTGINKVKVMVERGITVLIDDNPDVCRAVRDAGLIALQVIR